MRLVACPECHIQYDVTKTEAPQFRCHCGQDVSTVTHKAVDAEIHRCGSCGASVGPQAVKCDYCKSNIVRDERLLSLLCPECYSRNAEETSYCTNCGIQFQPQEAPLDAEVLDCPCCKEGMHLRSIGGVPIQECSMCNGLWVPEDNFDSLVNKAIESQSNRPSAGFGRPAKGGPVGTTQKVEYRKCPVCKGSMHRKNFGKRSGVIIDWCAADGTWLDADELEQIATYITQGGLQRTRSATLQTTTTRSYTKDQMEAIISAETLLAEERSKSEAKQYRWDSRRRHGDGNTLGDLLESLLGL